MSFGPSIPGETPLEDCSGLIDKAITTREQLNVAEFANISQATLKYLSRTPSKKRAPFDYAWFLKLHREMFGTVWDWAGCLRTVNLNIGKPCHQIPELLYQLVGNLPCWKERPLVEQAADLHFQAVSIHPFKNGNGRWSRMLANIWLKQYGLQPVAWPVAVGAIDSPVRAEYLESLYAADAGDLSCLIDLHKRFLGPTERVAPGKVRRRKKRNDSPPSEQET